MKVMLIVSHVLEQQGVDGVQTVLGANVCLRMDTPSALVNY